MKKFKEFGQKALEVSKKGAEAAKDSVNSARQIVTEAYLKSKTTLDLEDEITPELRQLMDQFYETRLIYSRLLTACSRSTKGKYVPLLQDVSKILMDIGLTAPPFATSFVHSQESLKKLYIACMSKAESHLIGHVNQFVNQQLIPANEQLNQFKACFSEFNINRMKIDEMTKKSTPESDPKYQQAQQQLTETNERLQALKMEVTSKLRVIHQSRSELLQMYLSSLIQAQAKYFEEAAALTKALVASEPLTKSLSPKESRFSFSTNQKEFIWPTFDATAIGKSHRKTVHISSGGVFVGTWNLGLTMPPPDLRSWLNPSSDHDIYVVGVQECEFKTGKADQTAEEIFFLHVKNTLGSKYTIASQMSILEAPTSARPPKTVWEEESDSIFSMAANSTPSGSQILANIVSGGTKAIPNMTGLAGIRMIVLVKKEHEDYLTDIQTSREVTGAGGLNFNKGAVGISFQFYDTKMCFVCCHLTPHAEKVEQRNTDLQDIIKEMSFGNPYVSFPTQFHHSVILGDYNYRIDMDRDQAISLAEGKKVDELLEYDQLRTNHKKGLILSEFKEGDITFLPTYKFERGTLNFDRTKPRTPSYCDRVMWRTMNDRPFTLVEYSSDTEIRTSDHSPVSAIFKFTYNTLPPIDLGDVRYVNFVISDINITYPNVESTAAIYLALHTYKASSITHRHRAESPSFHPPVSVTVSLPEIYRNPYLFVSYHTTRISDAQLGDSVVYLSPLLGPILAACDYPTSPYYDSEGLMISAAREARHEVQANILKAGLLVGKVSFNLHIKV